ncbi:hypothetical protein V6N13_026049 [Hibiscus sabdariffa]
MICGDWDGNVGNVFIGMKIIISEWWGVYETWHIGIATQMTRLATLSTEPMCSFVPPKCRLRQRRNEEDNLSRGPKLICSDSEVLICLPRLVPGKVE